MPRINVIDAPDAPALPREVRDVPVQMVVVGRISASHRSS
jgi:hypothetical protein